MKSRIIVQSVFPLVLACAIGFGNRSIRAAEDNPEQRAEIMNTAKAFVEAFHKGDAKALAAFWTPDGDYIDESGPCSKAARRSRILLQNSSLHGRD